MKNVFKIAAFAALLIGFTFQSCGVKPVDTAKLETNVWNLKTMNGEDAKTLFEGAIPTIQFNFTDSMVAGSSGCNRYFGKFSMTPENKFTAPALAGTMMACVHKNAEPEFLKIMRTPDLTVALTTEGTLTFSQEKNVLLEFEKGEAKEAMAEMHHGAMDAMATATTMVDGVAAATTAAYDKKCCAKEGEKCCTEGEECCMKDSHKATAEMIQGSWVMKKIAKEDVTAVFGEKLPTMEFTKEGKLSGNAGCNNYRSTFKMNDNTVTLTPIMSNKMTCDHIEGETKFTQFLSSSFQVFMSKNHDMLILVQNEMPKYIFVKK